MKSGKILHLWTAEMIQHFVSSQGILCQGVNYVKKILFYNKYEEAQTGKEKKVQPGSYSHQGDG